MPPLVSVRNDVSEEQTLQKFHTGVSCVTAQIRVVCYTAVFSVVTQRSSPLTKGKECSSVFSSR